MTKRDLVNADTEILIARHTAIPGSSLEDAPNKKSGFFSCTIKQLLSPSFTDKKKAEFDYYFMPGIHGEKLYRYSVKDKAINSKDFSFCLLPFDIDIKSPNGREEWKDRAEAKRIIDKLLQSTSLAKYVAVAATSLRGIRIAFVTERKVSISQWRWFYSTLVDAFTRDVQGEFLSHGKMSFMIDEMTLVLDGRNPGSLTRVPFGNRGGEPVTDSYYFYVGKNDPSAVLPIDIFGPVQEEEGRQPKKIKGYEQRHVKQFEPVPKKLAKLPKGLKPYEWPAGPPEQGGREIAIFHLVTDIKERFIDNLTPEQYYSYLYKAVCLDMDTKNAMIPAENQLWTKITRDFYIRSEATTTTGKKRDSTHFRNSGGDLFYNPKDFDKLKDTRDVTKYANKEIQKYVKEIDKSGICISVLHPPPGAGKSTVAKSIFKKGNCLYIAPANEHLKSFINSKELSRMTINYVYSFKELIAVVAESEEERKALLEVHEEYQHIRDNDPASIYIHPNVLVPKSFPAFIKIRFPEASTAMVKENKDRIKLLKDGKPSVITYKKFLRVISDKGVRELPEDYRLIFDEVDPEDVINPQVYIKKRPMNIWGSEWAPRLLDEDDLAIRTYFKEFIENRPTILINADRGVADALKHNGYENVKTYGVEMTSVLDNDLHLVFTSELISGYTPFRAEGDMEETSSKALMSGAVNGNDYLLITNGSDVNGKKLSKDNCVNAIGSNKFNNKKVMSFHTSPTPEEIAKMCFCTGMSREKAEDLVFQNKLNQIIGRNTGYRSYDSHVDYMESNGKKAGVHENVHYAIIQEKYRSRPIKLSVKTTNVWTAKSKRRPAVTETFFAPIDKGIRQKVALYRIEPGTCVSADTIAKSVKQSINQLVKFIKSNPEFFSDYTFKTGHMIDGVKKRNMIIRHKSIDSIVDEALQQTFSTIKLSAFVKKMKEISNEQFIKQLSVKALKSIISSRAHNYDLRLVRKNAINMICPTDEEFIFRETI